MISLNQQIGADGTADSSPPVFVDNWDGSTLARAITRHLEALRGEGRIPAELCVATCYFNPHGLEPETSGLPTMGGSRLAATGMGGRA